MKDKDEYFVRFKNPLNEFNLLKELVKKDRSTEDLNWKKEYGFCMLEVSSIIFPTFENFRKDFSAKFYILKIPPSCWYRWHKDTHRGAAINILILGNNCHTIFTSSDAEIVKDGIVEVDYSDNRPVILNTQEEHAVLNLGPERVIMSVSINLPITYKDVISYSREKNLLE